MSALRSATALQKVKVAVPGKFLCSSPGKCVECAGRNNQERRSQITSLGLRKQTTVPSFSVDNLDRQRFDAVTGSAGVSPANGVAHGPGLIDSQIGRDKLRRAQ
jgi:hypothetical protein